MSRRSSGVRSCLTLLGRSRATDWSWVLLTCGSVHCAWGVRTYSGGGCACSGRSSRWSRSILDDWCWNGGSVPLCCSRVMVHVVKSSTGSSAFRPSIRQIIIKILRPVGGNCRRIGAWCCTIVACGNVSLLRGTVTWEWRITKRRYWDHNLAFDNVNVIRVELLQIKLLICSKTGQKFHKKVRLEKWFMIGKQK